MLERLPTLQERTDAPLSLPVRYVQKDAYQSAGTGFQPRVLWGRIAHGAVKAGDTIEVLPSKQTAVVAEVRVAGDVASSAQAGTSARPRARPPARREPGRLDRHARQRHVHTAIPATLAWLDTEPAKPGRKYWVRHGNRWVQARISSIDSVLDIHNLRLRTRTSCRSTPSAGHDGSAARAARRPFASNRVGGALIVVDRQPPHQRALLVDTIPATTEEDW